MTGGLTSAGFDPMPADYGLNIDCSDLQATSLSNIRMPSQSHSVPVGGATLLRALHQGASMSSTVQPFSAAGAPSMVGVSNIVRTTAQQNLTTFTSMSELLFRRII